MPYASDRQRRFMHAVHPDVAAQWDAEIRKEKKMAARKKTVAALSREIAKLRKELAKHKASDKKIHSAAKRQRVSPQALSTIRDVNGEGLTFLEWLRAAGVVQPRETHRQAWVSGEDHADWRAAGSPKMRGPKVRVVPESYVVEVFDHGGTGPDLTVYPAQWVFVSSTDKLSARMGHTRDLSKAKTFSKAQAAKIVNRFKEGGRKARSIPLR